MNDYKFGNFICQLRTEKGLSQSELGDMMGVSNKAVSKWEMGVSKPRPAMLVVLASFFGVTVEELLAGERNPEIKPEVHEKKDDKGIKFWVGEYCKKKKHGRNAVITALILPVILFVYIGVAVSVNSAGTIFGLICSLIIFLAEPIDIVLIFVFYGSARRLKRILYATYPEQAEEITAIIAPKKERQPMLKWEKACLFTCGCCAIACQILRIVAEYVGEKARDALLIVGLSLAVIALIFVLVASIHYFLRCRRKK